MIQRHCVVCVEGITKKERISQKNHKEHPDKRFSPIHVQEARNCVALSLQDRALENYEDLRLERKDRIPKVGFWQRLFRREHRISEEHLEFLEDRLESPKEPLKESVDDDFLFLDDFLQENNALQENDVLRNDEQEQRGLESTSLGAEEKEAVLEMDLQKREIPLRFVCLSLVGMLFALLLFVPKIYMRNNIYYSSRNIIQLQAQLDSLNEENKHIKKQLEDIKFKNLTYELDF